MLSTKLKEAAGNSADATLYVDDVFSTYLYTGNGSTQTITNGIDLAGKGGLVWVKSRNTAENNALWACNLFGDQYLKSNNTDAIQSSGMTYLSNGFTAEAGFTYLNASGNTYASWTFRKAAKFFDVQRIYHANGTADNINLSVLGTVGMVIAKITSTTGDWTVWQRSLTASNNLKLNTTAAQSTTNAWLSVSGTTATLAAAAPTGTYVIYAYAHDTSSTGIIQCGSFTSTYLQYPNITLGWEPQYVLVKRTDIAGDWAVMDAMRPDFTATAAAGNIDTKILKPNSSAAETGGDYYFGPNATGFGGVCNFTSGTTGTYIYMAIRMPNKPPTTGAQVYNAIARTGTGAAATVTGVGFAPDLTLIKAKSIGDGYFFGAMVADRLRGQPCFLTSSGATAEAAGGTGDITAFNMDGASIGGSTQINYGYLGYYINWFFKRAPGFFDEVCYTGDSNQTTNRPHNLGVAPELMITKRRNGVGNWYVVYATSPTIGRRLYLNDASASNVWGATYFTSTTYYAGIDINTANCVSYLFATLAGISKVGSYTGNGTGQAIACGFSAGARFVLIKRTDDAGDWYTFDSARGLTSGSSPYLLLNSTAAETTGNNGVYASTGGFTLGSTASTTTNINAATYIFLAVA